jgi:hypothetical protein
MRAFVAIVIGTLLSLLGFEYGESWTASLGGTRLGAFVGWIGIALTLTAAWWQYREGLAFELLFEESDWQLRAQGEYQISVPAAQHRRRSGIALDVFLRNAHGYETVVCDKHVGSDQRVTIAAAMPFAGKVVIK